jgi:hypothetical protein
MGLGITLKMTASRPGEPAKNLSREQVQAIRHQVEADHLKRVQPQS